jgi:hypothetical protein
MMVLLGPGLCALFGVWTTMMAKSLSCFFRFLLAHGKRLKTADRDQKIVEARRKSAGLVNV